MVSEDPRQIIDTLRTQLATHDKRIAFLFGAGTSCAVRDTNTGTPLIPAVDALSKLCDEAVKDMGAAEGGAWVALTDECQSLHNRCDIEILLSRLRMKLDAMGTNDELMGLTRSAIGEIEKKVTSTIAKAVSPDEGKIPITFPHHFLAKWISATPRRFPIEIFTTNYDLLLERALEDSRVPVFDGFSGVYRSFFLPDSLSKAEYAPGSAWIRLWKIHGSVNWQWQNIAGVRRIVRTQPVSTGEMILPSHYKYDESRKQPYLTLLDRLRRVVEQGDTLLIACGCGFRDEHINSVIFEGLGARPRTHLIALQFEDVTADSDLDKAASKLTNLVVVGPKTGIIAGNRVAWALPTGSAEMNDVTILAKNDPGKAMLTEVRLGNFENFCAFLATLSAR
jgi:hypothetical protein